MSLKSVLSYFKQLFNNQDLPDLFSVLSVVGLSAFGFKTFEKCDVIVADAHALVADRTVLVRRAKSLASGIV